jgi:uncharacterized repeat protein (TIGR03803 family)
MLIASSDAGLIECGVILSQFFDKLILWLAAAGVALAISVPLDAAHADKYSVEYAFKGTKEGGSDGANSTSGVIADSAGNLYGTANFGGERSCPGSKHHGCGIVFELVPPVLRGGAWTEKVLYDFKGSSGKDGTEPSARLVADSVGNLYGTTNYGGSGDRVCFDKQSCGTVFKLAPNGSETVLYSFCIKGRAACTDGAQPEGLISDDNGNFYGTTYVGGTGHRYVEI